MNDNNQKRSHARRRPESVTHTNKNSGDSVERRRSMSAGQSRNTGNSARYDYEDPRRVQTGRSRVSGSAASAAVSTRAPQKADNKLVRANKRREIAERREAEWQDEVVRVRGGIDIFMLTIIIILIVLGSMTVFSASYPYAIKKGLDSYSFIVDQLKFILLGSIAMLITIVCPMKIYKKIAGPIAFSVSAVLLVAVLFIGTKEGVTSRWIDLGPINIQPSEVMKVSLILMIAWYVENFGKRMQDLDKGFKSVFWNTLIPDAIVGTACVLVLVGKHLSGTIIIGAIGVSLLVVAGCKIKWLISTILPVGVGAISLFLMNNKYALERITSFKNENADKLDELYQTTQSIYAIGSGGIFGVGLGGSRQKYSYLGAAHTDFIFSVWCEEWGFVGAVVLIILFILFMWRGYVIAMRAPDKFSMLLAFGITTHVGLQAFLNMCVAADIIMNTGITLPFFSYGGSALVIIMAEMGILLKISRQYYRKKADIEHDELLKKSGMI